MTVAGEPRGIALSELTEFIEQLTTTDPRDVISIHIDAARITILVGLRNERGNHYVLPDGDIATETELVTIDYSK